jgi:ribosomal protein L7/L12
VTGRRLYEIVCDARNAEIGSVNGEGQIIALPWHVVHGRAETSFSRNVPPAWAYLSRAERATWSAAANRIKPRPRPKPAPEKTYTVRVVETGPMKIALIKAIRAATGFGLFEAKEASEGVRPVAVDVGRETADRVAETLRGHAARIAVE